MPCTKFCSNHGIRVEVGVERNCDRIWIARLSCICDWHHKAWWRHDMEMLFALLTLYVVNIRVNRGVPSQRVTNVELWFFISIDWTSSWTNSQVLRYLRRHGIHVTSLYWLLTKSSSPCLRAAALAEFKSRYTSSHIRTSVNSMVTLTATVKIKKTDWNFRYNGRVNAI